MNRESFEEYARGKKLPLITGITGGYVYADTAAAWEAWQAALSQQAGEAVAVMYKDGSVYSKAEMGEAFDICCKVETPLYAAPSIAEPQR